MGLEVTQLTSLLKHNCRLLLACRCCRCGKLITRISNFIFIVRLVGILQLVYLTEITVRPPNIPTLATITISKNGCRIKCKDYHGDCKNRHQCRFHDCFTPLLLRLIIDHSFALLMWWNLHYPNPPHLFHFLIDRDL